MQIGIESQRRQFYSQGLQQQKRHTPNIYSISQPEAKFVQSILV